MKEFEKVIEVIKGWGYEEYDESPIGILTYRKDCGEYFESVVIYPDESLRFSHCGYGKGCFAVTDAEYDSFEDFFRGEGLTTYLD